MYLLLKHIVSKREFLIMWNKKWSTKEYEKDYVVSIINFNNG